MSRYYSYLNSAKSILTSYKGGEPLSAFLKKYFSANKKFGSTDRKEIASLCYCFCRLGKSAKRLTIEEGIIAGIFLCSGGPNNVLEAIKPEWSAKINLPLRDKLLIINSSLLIDDIFPWKNELSIGIEHRNLCESFLKQPELFIRLRPGNNQVVMTKLEETGIEFRIVAESCLALPNASKIDDIIELDKEAVIQDYSSQQTGKFFSYAFDSLRNKKLLVWDCCAASGGKSILAYDINPGIELIVSDIRESILANLRRRFRRAGIKNYQSFVADLSSARAKTADLIPAKDGVQVIICDAPCTGSGTWSRTPEQLYYFDEDRIEEFSLLQKKIASTAIQFLQKGGFFVYITCSVFKKENEEVVEYIRDNFNLQVKLMEVLPGYDIKADSMFAAVLEKL